MKDIESLLLVLSCFSLFLFLRLRKQIMDMIKLYISILTKRLFLLKIKYMEYTSEYENLITSEQKIRLFRPLDTEKIEQKEEEYYRLLSDSEPRDVAPRLEFSLHEATNIL